MHLFLFSPPREMFPSCPVETLVTTLLCADLVVTTALVWLKAYRDVTAARRINLK
eukprot:COSAG01_NODE_8711_length_2689_cov_2.501158_2_plen_55_part_00